MYNKLIKYKNKLSNYQITHYPKVAVCFYGLCRSTNYTIESINNFIFEPLKQLNFNYHIYLHTFNITTPYTNPRNNEENIMLDNNFKSLDNLILLRINIYHF